jgi:HSP20 family molecular chaperone IbpA
LTDIYNDEEGNQIIEMALAGFSKDQIDIEVLDNRIIIGSSIKQNKEEQIQDMEEAFSALESEFDNLPVSTYKRRIARRQFKKTFVDYDNQLDLENCEASFVDGLLRITIRKDKETALKKIIIK